MVTITASSTAFVSSLIWRPFVLRLMQLLTGASYPLCLCPSCWWHQLCLSTPLILSSCMLHSRICGRPSSATVTASTSKRTRRRGRWL